MFACCGRPAAASFCDPFAYIVFNYARETNRENLPGRAGSLGAALATASMSQTAAFCAGLRPLTVGPGCSSRNTRTTHALHPR